MEVTIGNTRLELVEGDITDQNTDAVVNAAHWDLLAGQGVDGAIHWKAGPQLLEECKRIGGCPIGGAVITSGYNLRARYIIHTVGPVYDVGDEHEADFLAMAYQSSLRLAVEYNLKSISLPSLSTGAFCYPLQEAAPVAMKAIVGFVQTEKHNLELVRFVLYSSEDKDAYAVYSWALSKAL